MVRSPSYSSRNLRILCSKCPTTTTKRLRRAPTHTHLPSHRTTPAPPPYIPIILHPTPTPTPIPHSYTDWELDFNANVENGRYHALTR